MKVFTAIAYSLLFAFLVFAPGCQQIDAAPVDLTEDADNPDRVSKQLIAQRLLQIDDELSEFDSAATCRTDSDCTALSMGVRCGPQFYMPYSELMPPEQSDRLKALVAKYRKLLSLLYSPGGCLTPHYMPPPQSPRMSCQVGRCVVGDTPRAISLILGGTRPTISRQAVRERLICGAKPAGRPGNYEFKLIVQARKPNSLGNSLSLNDNGEIAFIFRTPEQGEQRQSVMLYTKMGIQTVADFSTVDRYGSFSWFAGVSLHDQGAVLFRGSQGARGGISYGKPGSSPTMITRSDTNYILGSDEEYHVSSPAIISRGQIAFQMSWRDGLKGIGILGSNSITTMHVGERFSVYEELVINDNGTVAFRVRGKSARSSAKIFLFKNGEATLIASDGLFGGYKKVSRKGIAINNLDQVAFSVTKHFGETAVVVSADGEIQTVVDESGAYETVGRVVGITDDGTVAFSAKVRGSCSSGIYTGPDPIADKVVESGDEIDGIEVGWSGIQMNNRGEFAFMTDDGVERLYLAQPIHSSQHQPGQRNTPN
jgi:hypothetical protein